MRIGRVWCVLGEGILDWVGLKFCQELVLRSTFINDYLLHAYGCPKSRGESG